MVNVFHQHVPTNQEGDDYIVGDLHGCLDLLLTELDRIGFKPQVDRLFCVGDLIDRGPDSMGCLRLLREPWFFSVIGNHENMLLDYVYEYALPYGSRVPPMVFFRNGGGWVTRLSDDEEQELKEDLLPRVEQLPYVITVGDGQNQFHVAHAELMTGLVDPNYGGIFEGNNVRILDDTQLTEENLAGMTGALTWGRRVLRRIKFDLSKEAQTVIGPVFASQQPMHPGLSLTYVGHSPLKSMFLHESHLYIDRGAFLRDESSCLLVLRHDDVQLSLKQLLQ